MDTSNFEQQQWGEQNEQSEQQKLMSHFEAQFSKMGWYAEFTVFFNGLDESRKTQFLKTYSISKDNENLADFLDDDVWEWFPYDDESFAFLVEKFNPDSQARDVFLAEKLLSEEEKMYSDQDVFWYLSMLFSGYPELAKTLGVVDGDRAYNEKLFADNYGAVLEMIGKKSAV
jgi:hypothetical protein